MPMNTLALFLHLCSGFGKTAFVDAGCGKHLLPARWLDAPLEGLCWPGQAQSFFKER